MIARRSLIALSVVVFAGIGALSACDVHNPCASLPPAPPALVQQAGDSEIERTGDDGATDCVLTPDGVWTPETED